MPLHFRALSDQRYPAPRSTTGTEIMLKSRYLSSIALYYHHRFWLKNGDFSVSDSMNVVSDTHLIEGT